MRRIARHRHPEGIQVNFYASQQPGTLAWAVRYRGLQVASGDDFKPSPLHGASSKQAAADLLSLLFDPLLEKGEISDEDEACQAAQLLMLDWQGGQP